MKLASFRNGEREEACIVTAEGAVPISEVNRLTGADWPVQLYRIIAEERLDALRQWAASVSESWLRRLALPAESVRFAPLYRTPRKIWGIGFNYVRDPEELQRVPPDEEPVGFMKPDTTIVGHMDNILIPRESERTTAEGELAIVIGKRCRNVGREAAASCIAGYASAIDVTADDIHQRNPRFLTRAKSFDTFFSFGPVLLTPDEFPKLGDVVVETVINGEVVHRNRVANMRFHPHQIVAFHSRVMTLLPGDVILTGTPGAAVIRDGDLAECRIAGHVSLANRVVDLKRNQTNSKDVIA